MSRTLTQEEPLQLGRTPTAKKETSEKDVAPDAKKNRQPSPPVEFDKTKSRSDKASSRKKKKASAKIQKKAKPNNSFALLATKARTVIKNSPVPEPVADPLEDVEANGVKEEEPILTTPPMETESEERVLNILLSHRKAVGKVPNQATMREDRSTKVEKTQRSLRKGSGGKKSESDESKEVSRTVRSEENETPSPHPNNVCSIPY